MHADEFPQFREVLVRLGELYPKKITDDTVQAYWHALKDLSLSTVKRFADQHGRFGKFFPKPVELRPKDEKPPLSDPKTDGSFKEGEERAIRNLEALRQKSPDEWIERVAAAKGADCNAIQLHRQYGEQLWYDLPNRCWRT